MSQKEKSKKLRVSENDTKSQRKQTEKKSNDKKEGYQ
jgi:hypothetical protein